MAGEFFYEPEHADAALADLFSQFDDSANLRDLISAICVGVQEFEDLAYDYAVTWMLEVAGDTLLTRLGKFVGSSRLGLTDDEYRDIIRARIAAQRSSGTISEIANVLRLSTGAETVEYTTAYPAGYRFFFTSTNGTLTADQASRAAQIMELARPAGVDASYVEAAGGEAASTFRFDDSARGFGSLLPRLLE